MTLNLQTITSKITVKKILVILILSILAGAIYWLSIHAYIEVTVSNTTSGNVNYQLYNQSSKQTTNISTSANKTKKLVRKGDYEVLVKQTGSSYFSVAPVKGFLQTTTVSGELKPEDSRTFVGNNPGSCMNYVDNRLLSYSCSDVVARVNTHVPAGPGQPTIIQRRPNSGYGGYVESILTTKEGTMALVRSAGSNDVDLNASHFIYIFDANLNVVSGGPLPGLPEKTVFNAVNYKDGFLVYDAAFGRVLYYSSYAAEPVNVAKETAQNKDIAPISLSVQDDKIIRLYTHSTEVGDDKPASEAVIEDGQSSLHYKFNRNYTKAFLCGNQKMCLQGDGRLDVYNIANTKPSLLYSVSDVVSIEDVEDGVLVFREKDVLSLDVDKQSGYLSYDLGDYRLAGSKIDGNNYVLSLLKPDKQKIALYINRTGVNKDSIDKKILEVEKVVGIKSVSIYGNYITITPNLGSAVYQNGGYGYTEAAKQTARTSINEGLSKLGIPATYTIQTISL